MRVVRWTWRGRDKDEAISKWLATLPPMRTGSPSYTLSPSIVRIYFKRNEDAVIFKLKFGDCA